MKTKSLLGAALGMATVATMQACGSARNPAAPTRETCVAAVIGAPDPALVGSWSGSLNGTGGPDTGTFVLASDGGMSTWGTKPFYSRLQGTWGASGARFTAVAQDPTVVVSFTATISARSISGTWCGDNGTAGTFSIEKQ